MTKYKELSDKQKFLFWFLPISILITVVTFLIVACYFPALITLYGIFYYPIIISVLSGSLGTYFYFQKVTKMVIYYSMVLLGINTLFVIYIYSTILPEGISLTTLDVVGIPLIWGMAVVIHISGHIVTSFFVSQFLNPRKPTVTEIREHALCYELNDFEPKKIIDAFSLILEQIFYYTTEKKRKNNDRHLGILLRANPTEYVFLDFLKEEKKLFILPFRLKYFIEIICNVKESQSIQNFLSILLKFNKIEPNRTEWRGFMPNFIEIVKPIRKDTLETIRVFLIPVIVTVGLLLFAVFAILNPDFLGNLLQEIEISTIIGGVIIGMITFALIAAMTTLWKKRSKK
ncbi:MAG: hypothetical protein KAW45_02570 [Thermoplasmatales archaeon]|nr:hypothetical protein [Thermoplasmatales archaeon]